MSHLAHELRPLPARNAGHTRRLDHHHGAGAADCDGSVAGEHTARLTT